MKKMEEDFKQRKTNEIIVPFEDEFNDSEFEIGNDMEMYDEDGMLMDDIGEFDPDDCTAEELAELEIIFGHPISSIMS